MQTYRKSWVFGGLAAVVVIILIAAAADSTGRLAVLVGAPAAVLFFLGLLLYQWGWAGKQDTVPIDMASEVDPSADPGALTDYWEMYRLMAVGPIDVEALNASQASVMDGVRANIKLGAFIAILPILGAVMVITGWVPDLDNGRYAVLIPVALAPAALAWSRWQIKSSGAAATDTLKPLGLVLTEMPDISLTRSRSYSHPRGMDSEITGATVMEGVRHGRNVKIRLGKRHVTQVLGEAPEFRVKRGRGNKLQVDGSAPAPVSKLVDGLGASEKWKALRGVTSGPKGIRVERSVDAESGWIWDLWLAEHLADAVGVAQDVEAPEPPAAEEVPWILGKDA